MGVLFPEIAPGVQSEVRKLLDSARLESGAGEKSVESPWPSAEPNPVPESRALGFFCMDSPCLFPVGVGFFFDDRPFGDGFTFAKWIAYLVFYNDGRFIEDVAFPFVALNLMYRRRSVDRSGLFLKIHVGGEYRTNFANATRPL